MASWQTCVVCWRAWYAVDFNFGFARAAGKRGERHQWYKPGESVILGARRKKNIDRWYIDTPENSRSARRMGAQKFLERNYPERLREELWQRLVGKPWCREDMNEFWPRDATICRSCLPHVQDGTLLPASDIRLCDYAVDPVSTTMGEDGQTLSATRERWEDHTIASDEEPTSTSDPPHTCISGSGQINRQIDKRINEQL